MSKKSIDNFIYVNTRDNKKTAICIRCLTTINNTKKEIEEHIKNCANDISIPAADLISFLINRKLEKK